MKVLSRYHTPPFCFINPFSNHSYLTFRAISLIGKTYLFCPPLQLQLLFGNWRSNDLSLGIPNIFCVLLNVLCILSFILYRLRITSYNFYLSSFRFLLLPYLRHLRSCHTYFFYQDYVSDLLATQFPDSTRVCELIIHIDPLQDNYHSTLNAIRQSSAVVVPNLSLLEVSRALNTFCFLAPYGGDKTSFYSSFRESFFPRFFVSNSISQSSSTKCTFSIIARSNSFRKGADVLLQALPLLNFMLSKSSIPLILNFVIAGSIRELPLTSEYSRILDIISSHPFIQIDCRQFSQSGFSQLLRSADLFIMPSRLESTSLAALEALWHGVPSILSSACGVDDFVDGRHGILLTQHNPRLLANVIYDLVTNSDLLQSYRRYLLADSPKFSWIRYFHSYKGLLY
jgi:glycosyltransferase involved in cell wall biosynthesis